MRRARRPTWTGFGGFSLALALGCASDDGREPTAGEAESTDASSSETTSSGTRASESSDGSESSTGAAPEADPVYPPQVNGACTTGIPVSFGEATLCAPACVDGDPCPIAASGTAEAACIPFDGDSEVAFWACLLSCAQDQVCPDAMACAGPFSACGYL